MPKKRFGGAALVAVAGGDHLLQEALTVGGAAGGEVDVAEAHGRFGARWLRFQELLVLTGGGGQIAFGHVDGAEVGAGFMEGGLEIEGGTIVGDSFVVAGQYREGVGAVEMEDGVSGLVSERRTILLDCRGKGLWLLAEVEQGLARFGSLGRNFDGVYERTARRVDFVHFFLKESEGEPGGR